MPGPGAARAEAPRTREDPVAPSEGVRGTGEVVLGLGPGSQGLASFCCANYRPPPLRKYSSVHAPGPQRVVEAVGRFPFPGEGDNTPSKNYQEERRLLEEQTGLKGSA